MTDYKSIIGKAIKVLDTNPDNAQAEGQIWFNETTGVFKNLLKSEAWSSVGALGVARADSAGAGSTPAGLVFGGTPASGVTAATEEYNGSGFASGGDMGTARRALGGTGTQTAGLAIGGYVSGPAAVANVEEYDGSSWSEQNDIPTALWKPGALGIQTAALSMGGKVVTPENEVSSSYEYDGTNWTTGGNLGTGRYGATGGGTQTAGIAAGGFVVPNTQSGSVELYDGTSWTSATSLNTARNGDANQGGGTDYTNVLVYGGTNPSSGKTESWDGTSWTEKADMASNTNRFAGATASSSTGFAAGGAPTSPASKGFSEEFTSSVNVITADAYSALPNLNNARDVEGFGSKNGTTTAALVGNGGVPPNGMSNYTEEFDGSSWTAGGNLPGSWRHSGGSGIQTACICVGGFNGPSNLNGVYHYGGSSWTSGGNYPVAQYAVSVAGTQTAAIAAGGGSDTTPANTYNGSSWTSAGTMSIGRSWFGSAGSTTAALVIGGNNAPTGQCEEYDGSSWTSGGNMASGRTQVTTCSFGTQTAAGQAGANTPVAPAAGKINYLQTYDGTSWLTGANMATSRNNGSGTGTTSSHLVAAGYGPGSTYQNTAEEFTTGSSAIPAKTLTTS